MSTQTIKLRQSFLDYFRLNEHKLMPRSKVFNDDPTLFFVNAGMNQLKDVFLGERQVDSKYVKLMNSQICIRAGGKHNDFDDVGKDSYHLTCFEMLGNWSINQYGKKEAIDLAYRFLIDVCKLKKEQMYVTYFQGDTQAGVMEDIETRDIWRQYFSDDRIIKGNFTDNFWMMADNGPCGVCTEIHYDMVGNRNAADLVNTGDPQVIEIWNNVFIQYNKNGSNYEPLGKMYVDTGMGLERLSMIMNGQSSLYQTDAFKYLFGYAQALTNADFYENHYSDSSKKDISYRIFADHIRTTIIALHHGVEFDFSKRGFILRKIFRRMMTHMYLYLNNMTISPIMNKPIIKCLITDVLNYFLENGYDVNLLQQKLIVEEKLYIGKLRNIKKTYENIVKKNKNINDAIVQLKQTHGIDPEMVPHINQLRIDAKQYS